MKINILKQQYEGEFKDSKRRFLIRQVIDNINEMQPYDNYRSFIVSDTLGNPVSNIEIKELVCCPFRLSVGRLKDNESSYAQHVMRVTRDKKGKDKLEEYWDIYISSADEYEKIYTHH